MGLRRPLSPELAAPVPSQALNDARDALEVLDGVDVLDAWQWNTVERCWTISCRFTIPTEGHGVPKRSDWVVLVEATYPWGYIHLQPAMRNSVEATFPHQLLNRPANVGRPWRTGRICVDTGVRALGRQGVDREPFSVAGRLRWRLERTRRWLEVAACGGLVRPGDPFELPDFGSLPKPLVAFGENVDSLETWDGEKARYGVVRLVRLRQRPPVLVATSFRDLGGREVYAPRWGTYINDPERPSEDGLWLRFNGTPHIEPWKAPMTWGELRRAAAEQDINLDEVLQRLLERTRFGGASRLLVGFPIPAVVDGAARNMFWQALQLPEIPIETGMSSPGFRPGRARPTDVTRLAAFRDECSLTWLHSENWHADTVAARGQLPEVLTDAEVVLIGAGALGSAIGEMLVRGGLRRLTVYDHDLVMAGNLVRHTLTLSDVGSFKAAALANRLNAISASTEVRAITQVFPPDDELSHASLRTADIVIDATGENAVAHALSTYRWNSPKIFVSISLGLFAWAGFSFFSIGESFPMEDMLTALRPWLDRQAERFRDAEWPREGVGCWHPVFPARGDEVWMLASSALQHLVELVQSESDASELVVFERVEENGLFLGLRRVLSV